MRFRRWLVVWGALCLLLAAPAAAQLSLGVSPDNGTHADPVLRLANSVGNTVIFTVFNNGTIDTRVKVTCAGLGNVSPVPTCPWGGGILAVGTSPDVTVTFGTGAVGSGSVQLTAISVDQAANPTGASSIELQSGSWGGCRNGIR